MKNVVEFYKIMFLFLVLLLRVMICNFFTTSGIYAYVVLKENVTEPESDIIKELKDSVKKNVASFAVPDRVQVV